MKNNLHTEKVSPVASTLDHEICKSPDTKSVYCSDPGSDSFQGMRLLTSEVWPQVFPVLSVQIVPVMDSVGAAENMSQLIGSTL